MKPHRLRKTKPYAARIAFGLAMMLCVIVVYAVVPSLRAATVGVERAIIRVAAIKGPIIARAFLFHVPFRRQQHALSCEVASLRTALAGINVHVPEWDLWLSLPKDQTRKQTTKAGVIWGDPSEGFVGNVDGRMPSTGYGVFIDPIAEVAQLYASTTRLRVNDTYAIDAALSAKHPIVAWSVIGSLPPRSYAWKTPAGKSITAPAYEHTVVIVGYRGTVERFEGIYLIDPLTSLRYEPWGEFLERTEPFAYVGLEVAPR